MTPDSARFNDWLTKAENDLKAAEAILNYYEEPPTDTACYHCHQTAEKTLKAFLIAKAAKVPRAHDLTELVNLCVAADPQLKEFKEAASTLNRYYIEAKYPPDEPFFYPVPEARQALALARDIFESIKKKLS